MIYRYHSFGVFGVCERGRTWSPNFVLPLSLYSRRSFPVLISQYTTGKEVRTTALRGWKEKNVSFLATRRLLQLLSFVILICRVTVAIGLYISSLDTYTDNCDPTVTVSDLSIPVPAGIRKYV